MYVLGMSMSKGVNRSTPESVAIVEQRWPLETWMG
jgi:hypothetical protein